MKILFDGNDSFSWRHDSTRCSIWNNSIIIMVHKDAKYSSCFWWYTSLICYLDRIWSSFKSFDKLKWRAINYWNDCSLMGSIGWEMFVICDIFDGSLTGEFFIGTRFIDLSNTVFIKLKTNTFWGVELYFGYKCFAFVIWWGLSFTNDA